MDLTNLQPLSQMPTFSGIFRMTSWETCRDQRGRAYWQMRLSCASGDYWVLINLERCSIPERIGHLDLVDVNGGYWADAQHQYIMPQWVKRADQGEIGNLPILHSLPRAYCPVPVALDQLVKAIQSLESVHLQQFVRLVLERKGIMRPFLSAPASRGYHHNHPGGLLEHSLEVARSTVGMIRMFEPQTPRLIQEVGYVAGLLHDIGKTFVFNENGRPTASARLCEHDKFTLEACASGLSYLDQHLPDIATTLRHIWTCASPGARYGSKPAMTLARYVRDADGQSAMADNQHKAFRGKAMVGFSRLRNNQYWMPAT